MRKTFLFPLIASGLALSAIFASNTEVSTFDPFGDEIGNASAKNFGDDTPINVYQKTAELTPVTTTPTIGDKFGIQVSSVSKSGTNNVRSVRFIAEVSDLNCSVEFNRTIKSLGDDKKVSDDDKVLKAEASIEVDSAYTSIANGTDTYSPTTSGNYLVVYTMRNVPEAYWDSYFDVSVTLTYLDSNSVEKTITSSSHKANILGGLHSDSTATITTDTDGTSTIAYTDSTVSNSSAIAATLEIPDSSYPAIAVKKVEDSSISTMSFGDNVTTIGEAAFSNKVGTASESNGKGSDYANYESSYTGLTSVGFTSQTITIGDFAFAGCTNLKTITWPTGSTGSPATIDVGYGSFAGTGITEIDIPDSRYIQAYAFGGCPKLQKVTIYNECLCDNELSDNPSLETVIFDEKINDSLNQDKASAGGLTFVAGIDGEDKSPFKNCPALKTVTVNCKTTREDIWANAFAGCTSLETFDAANSSSTALSANMFKGCKALKTINLTTNVTKIDASTFANCGSSNVTINYAGTLSEFEGKCGSGWYTGATVTVKASDNTQIYSGLNS